jgi:hypothetical protein
MQDIEQVRINHRVGDRVWFEDQKVAALRDFSTAYDRLGSCVTRIAGPNGDAQLYER